MPVIYGGLCAGAMPLKASIAFTTLSSRKNTTVDAARHDGFEAYRREVAFALDMPRVFQLQQAIVNRLRIIGHALEAALVHKALLPVREVEQAPLERGRAQIRDQYLHGRRMQFEG